MPIKHLSTKKYFILTHTIHSRMYYYYYDFMICYDIILCFSQARCSSMDKCDQQSLLYLKPVGNEIISNPIFEKLRTNLPNSNMYAIIQLLLLISYGKLRKSNNQPCAPCY